MSKRLLVFLLAVSMTVVVAGISALGDDHENELPEHAHILVLNAELSFSPEGEPDLTYDKCIDLANNNKLKLNAHHEHVHFGETGVSFGGASGNIVGPADGFPGIPWTDCDSLADFFPPND